jgi:hypothetical protein
MTDNIKPAVLAAIGTGLTNPKTSWEIQHAIEARLGLNTIEEIGIQTISQSETMIRVKGSGGLSRYFKVKVSEVL